MKKEDFLKMQELSRNELIEWLIEIKEETSTMKRILNELAELYGAGIKEETYHVDNPITREEHYYKKTIYKFDDSHKYYVVD